MYRISFAILILTAFITGCATTANLPSSPPDSYLANKMVMPGAQYEMTLKETDPEGATISYFGTVESASEDTIVLKDVVKRVKIERPVPIPLVGKLFTNKSVGGKLMDGPVHLRRTDVAKIEWPQ